MLEFDQFENPLKYKLFMQTFIKSSTKFQAKGWLNNLHAAENYLCFICFRLSMRTIIHLGFCIKAFYWVSNIKLFNCSVLKISKQEQGRLSIDFNQQLASYRVTTNVFELSKNLPFNDVSHLVDWFLIVRCYIIRDIQSN